MQSIEQSNWELRLYSRDSRFTNHQVHKVTQSYTPKANDELELVIGDYIYIEQKEFDISPDGWVHGTSWLTGVSGCLPAVYTKRTAESDAWTLHRSISLSNNNSGVDCKSESDINAGGEMANSQERSSHLARDKSEEIYRDWETYWQAVRLEKTAGILNITQGTSIDWSNGAKEKTASENHSNGVKDSRRWVFAMRHGERVDLTYGPWVQHCFDADGAYTRKDLNLPIQLAERAGGAEAYAKDTPLTRVGRMQAYLVGEGLRMAGIQVRHVYASAALRCVETAHAFLEGLRADPSVKIKVEPGLFEYKMWHMVRGPMAPFMTPAELHKGGYNVDLSYKPYVDLDLTVPEELEDFFQRNAKVMQTVVQSTESEGGNMIFVGHAATLDIMANALIRLKDNETDYPPYEISKNLLRVPYCALAAMRDSPLEVAEPPCPPSINSSSGRYDWKMLLGL